MVTVGLDDGADEMNASSVTRAPTLLLIHGFLDDASVWDGLVDSLGGEVATVRYDLPGFGTRSGSVAEARIVTLESLATEAGDVLAGVEGPVIVVGQSLGTQVAELVAGQHPEQVRGLVLLTPVPLGGTRLPDEVVAGFRALGGDRDAQRAVRAELSPHMGDEQLDRLVEVGATVAADVVSHYVDVWNNGLDVWDNGVNDAPGNSAFGGPVLIIRGGADAFVTEQLAGEVGLRFARAEEKVIDKGGHWVHVEHPWAVAAMILDFADAVRGETA
jgi:pimeloyl-ACP methyl ester carboxylesterase